MHNVLVYYYFMMCFGRPFGQRIVTEQTANIASNPTRSLAKAWHRPLVREITVVLCVKLLLMVGIRIAWFSDRPADDLEPSAVADVLFSSSSSARGAASPFHPMQRDQP